MNLIEPQLFLPLAASARADTLEQMAGALLTAEVFDIGFHAGVIEREGMASTSLGIGIAIPHSMIIDARTSRIAVYFPTQPFP